MTIGPGVVGFGETALYAEPPASIAVNAAGRASFCAEDRFCSPSRSNKAMIYEPRTVNESENSVSNCVFLCEPWEGELDWGGSRYLARRMVTEHSEADAFRILKLT